MSGDIDVANSLGKLMEFHGFSPRDGKVWAILYMRQRNMTSKQLQDETGLSHTMVNDALKTLQRHGLVSRVPSLDNSFHFRSNNNLDDVIKRVHRSKANDLVDAVLNQVQDWDTDEELKKAWTEKFKGMKANGD